MPSTTPTSMGDAPAHHRLPKITPVPLDKHLYDELSGLITGDVYLPSNPNYKDLVKIFNGNVQPCARAVVCPSDTEDVSQIVQFCQNHSLSLSVKAGGFGTAGWAIAGEIVIDLVKLNDIDIEIPKQDGSFTSLRDMKGKGRAQYDADGNRVVDRDGGDVQDARNPVVDGDRGDAQDARSLGKRRRENDDHLRLYDDASGMVASFLGGPPLPQEDGPSPSVRRRLDPFSDTDGVFDGDARSSSMNIDGSTATTTVAPAPVHLSIHVPMTDGSAPSPMTDPSVDSSRGSSALLVPGPWRSIFEKRPSSDGNMHGSSRASSSSGPRGSPVAVDGAPIPVTELTPMDADVSGRASSASSSAGVDSSNGGGGGGGGDGGGADPFDYLSDSPVVHDPSPPMVPGPRGFLPLTRSQLMSSSSSSSLTPSTSSMRFWGDEPSALYEHSANTVGARPIHSHAFVTFGAGKRTKEVDQFCAANPLEARQFSGLMGHMPYFVPFAAHPVGSSVMLLGGFGFLGRLHGLSIDNLVEAEVVLASGKIVIVNEKEHPDLWWGLRGAGTAFGIATRYKARAYPVPSVFAGNLIYRFHRSTAPSLIKHFRDCVKGAPRELYANVLLTAGPAGKDSLVVIQICYIGPRDQGQEFLSAFSSWSGEQCLLNEVADKSFLRQQDSVAQVLRGNAGRQWFIRSALITSLPDDIINKTVMEFADAPVGCTWLFELAGGAIANKEDTCVPKSQREALFTIAALHQWELDMNDPRCIEAAQGWIQDTLAPVNVGGPYPSFIGRTESPERIKASYGENWNRLVELKHKYDPDNLFCHSLWPLDKTGADIDLRVHEPPAVMQEVEQKRPSADADACGC